MYMYTHTDIPHHVRVPVQCFVTGCAAAGIAFGLITFDSSHGLFAHLAPGWPTISPPGFVPWAATASDGQCPRTVPRVGTQPASFV